MGYIVSGLVVRTLAFVLLLPGLVYGLSSSKFRFKLNQLYEVSVGLENLRGTPLAFGDLSGTNDQLVDLVIASADQKTVEVWEWSRSAREFSHAAAADIKVADGFLVSNAIVGDFDADGHLDILLQSVSTKTKEVRMQLFLGNSSSSLGFAAYGGDIDSANDAMPFAIDYDGSGCVALLGGAPWSQRDNATAPPAWMWASEPAQAAALLTARPATLFQPINSTAAPTAMCRPASPHSSAFVDVDGDCRADLFVVCEGGTDYQIWASGSERGYTYSQTGQLPAGAGAVAFADMNGDGSVDMVVAMPGKSQIQILYNEQRPLCIGKNGRDCRDFERICEADAQFAFSAPADAQVVDFSAAWPGETLLAALADFQGPAPAAVRVGDVDLDGFPDLAFVTTRAGGETRVRLMRSAACSGCHAGGTRRRVDVRS
ncbi:hypothetical protein EV174_002234 [Coemansia sp. RSA 2320]|nr:hypothetical protein EV174_002234 [Coemansia sp. RSA 2320]